MSKNIFCLLSIFFFFNALIFAQNDQGYLEIKGSVKVDRSPLPGAKILIFKDGVQEKVYSVDSKGKFEFSIGLNGLYEVVISKQGYYSKKLSFNTKVPEDELGIWNYKFMMSMIHEIEGFDASLLNEPIGKIMYVEDFGEFDYDEVYTFDMLKKLEALMKQYEKARREAYKKVITKADQAFQNKDYDTAVELYDKAIELDPYETYPDDQIYAIGKILKQDDNAQKNYDENIELADNYYRQQDYSTAKKYYQRALKYIESKYPKDQIAAIDEILLNQDSLLADQAAKNKAYTEAVANGDRLFIAKQYEQALSKFNEATGIKPEEQYPKDKITEISAILEQLNQDKHNKEQLEKAYREAIAKADADFSSKNYEGARGNYVKASQLKLAETYPKTKIKEIDVLIAASNSLNEKYQGFIAVADQAFLNKEYELAKKNYQQALSIKANEVYPKNKINEIDAILMQLAQQRLKDADANYSKFIAVADALFNKKEYENSKNNYNQALAIKNNEVYPKQRIAEIDKILADLATKKRNYDLAVSRADNNFNIEKWDEAKVDYQKALTIFPDEQYPQTRLNEIENKLLALKSAADQKNARELAYKKALALADTLFLNKKYQESKNSYSQALAIKPAENYPKQKIASIEQLMAANKVLDEKFNAFVAIADKQFVNKDYTNAKTNYTNALQIKPNETYPKQKIAEIDAKLASNKQLDLKYKEAIAAADQLFNNKQYNDAKVTYTNASALKPNEAYPKQKIAEIDALIAELKDVTERYNAIIIAADNHFNRKNYNDAKVTYNNALNLKPNESYPKQKIAEIDQILTSNKALNDRYASIITTADDHFNNKRYEEAKATYSNALQLKPNETYPKDRISEIDVLLAEQAVAQAKINENKKKYDAFITQADMQYNAKSFEQAKSLYKQASEVMPDEVYPKQKLVEINNMLAANAANEKEYSEAIASADQLFTAKSYGEALALYNKAIGIKPGEAYPKQRITEINSILAKDRQKEAAYSNFIKLADAEYSNNNLHDAKAQYQSALGLKPAEEYPKSRIAEIDKLLAEQAKLANEKEKLDNQYKALIAKADAEFNLNNYAEAKQQYANATQLKPNEMYPKEKIVDIDNILETLAAKDEAYKTKMAEGERLFTDKNYNGALASYQSASQLKPDEQLPKQKITEIQGIIAENTKKDDQYNAFIKQADNLFNEKKYTGAKPIYQSALAIKPGESYPKTQITKIDVLVAEAAKRDAELREILKEYNAKIAEADKLYNNKNYDDAIALYMDAKMIKIDESYPDDQIAKINQIIKANAEKREADYNNAITNGDKLKTSKSYDLAIEQYNVALGIKPNDAVAKAKIAEVHNLVDQEKAAADKKAKILADYNKYITQADNAFKTNDYGTAISLYKSARNIKPDEQYPSDQINKCENKLNEQKVLAASEEEKRRAAELAAAQSSFDNEEFDYTGEERDKSFLNELAKKYPEGVTVENYEKKNKKIKRVIVNHNGIAKEYIEVQYSYGTFYFRNGQNISRSIFYSETK